MKLFLTPILLLLLEIVVECLMKTLYHMVITII